MVWLRGEKGYYLVDSLEGNFEMQWVHESRCPAVLRADFFSSGNRGDEWAKHYFEVGGHVMLLASPYDDELSAFAAAEMGMPLDAQYADVVAVVNRMKENEQLFVDDSYECVVPEEEEEEDAPVFIGPHELAVTRDFYKTCHGIDLLICHECGLVLVVSHNQD